jgi:hypothetical protein
MGEAKRRKQAGENAQAARVAVERDFSKVAGQMQGLRNQGIEANIITNLKDSDRYGDGDRIIIAINVGARDEINAAKAMEWPPPSIRRESISRPSWVAKMIHASCGNSTTRANTFVRGRSLLASPALTASRLKSPVTLWVCSRPAAVMALNISRQSISMARQSNRQRRNDQDKRNV